MQPRGFRLARPWGKATAQGNEAAALICVGGGGGVVCPMGGEGGDG